MAETSITIFLASVNFLNSFLPVFKGVEYLSLLGAAAHDDMVQCLI